MEWISVEDRLPEPFEDVLVWFYKDWNAKIALCVSLAYYSDKSDSFVHSDYGRINAQAWMPLPDPQEDE